MIRVFIIYKPKKLIVTKETDRDLRKEFSSFELINTYKTRRGIKEKVNNLAVRYKVTDIDYRLYIPGRKMIAITDRPIEQQLEIGRKISAAKKGFKMSEEWKAKISAAHRGKKIVRTTEQKIMYASYRTKTGWKYKWATNPYTGQNKQIALGKPLPEGFVYGRNFNSRSNFR